MSVENLLARWFIARQDVKAIQHPDGAWKPVTKNGKVDGERMPFTRKDLQDHVAGTRSYGHYMLDMDDTCKLFAFDLDLDKTGFLPNGLNDLEEINPREVWLSDNAEAKAELTTSLLCIGLGLRATAQRVLGIKTAVTYSGSKGLHVYGLFGERVPAETAREAAMEVLDDIECYEPVRGKSFWKHRGFPPAPHIGYQNLTIEVFPKQVSLDGKDLGNLMRLPLGINPKTKHEAFFINPEADLDAGLVPMDPEAALA